MKEPSIEAVPRRRRYGWWIAGGIFAVLIALPLGTVIYYAKPIGVVYNFVYGLYTGNPSIPGCDTTVVREATVGPLWYRLVKVNCSRDQSYWLYTKRSADAGWRPAFTSIGSPVPVSVRQADDGHFEVVLEAPLADGRATVPLIFDQDGSIRELQQFDHGSPSGHP